MNPSKSTSLHRTVLAIGLTGWALGVSPSLAYHIGDAAALGLALGAGSWLAWIGVRAWRIDKAIDGATDSEPNPDLPKFEDLQKRVEEHHQRTLSFVEVMKARDQLAMQLLTTFRDNMQARYTPSVDAQETLCRAVNTLVETAPVPTRTTPFKKAN
jgi:hypothetical protein